MLELDDEVAEPVLRIELDDLKMKSGKPFVAFVEKIPEEDMVSIMRTLPGEFPLPAVGAAPVEGEAEQKIRKWLAWAPALIQAACYMVRSDGTEVRPAFYWGERKPGATKGTHLSARDRTKLMNGILELSGWAKGAAAPAAFHAGVGGGGDGGAGAVDAGEGGGPDPVGSGA
jgi:hypothetical protein